MKKVRLLGIAIFLFFAVVVFSLALNNTVESGSFVLLEENGGGAEVIHHSHPTVMSLQGKVEGISSGALGVKISEQESCTQGVIFDYNYADAIESNLFSLSLGTTNTLSLNYNQDYYMCLYVNGSLVGNPQVFRGGQGQVDIEDVNTAGFATELVPYSGAADNMDLGSYDLQTTGNICLKDGCNAKMYFDTETGDVVIEVE